MRVNRSIRFVRAMIAAMALVMIAVSGQESEAQPLVLGANDNKGTMTPAPRTLQEDYDHRAEQYSPFWEKVLDLKDKKLRNLIANVEGLLAGDSEEGYALAQSLLDQALVLSVENPKTHYLLGTLHKKRGQWDACARELEHTHTLFTKSRDWRKGYELRIRALDQEIADCLLFSGQLDKAIGVYQRLIDGEVSSTLRLYLRLGEALMAAGRLDQALYSLRLGLMQQHRHARGSRALRGELIFTLAVALDRAGLNTESKQLLAPSVASQLAVRTHIFTPTSEKHYYLGLANEARGRMTRAIYEFRRFIKVAPASQWRTRAREHLETLAVRAAGADLQIVQATFWPRDQLVVALRNVAPALRRCVAGRPVLLISISLLVLEGPGKSRLQARAVPAGFHSLSPPALSPIIQCLETAARKIHPPKRRRGETRLATLRGGDTHAQADFLLLGSAFDK